MQKKWGEEGPWARETAPMRLRGSNELPLVSKVEWQEIRLEK